MATRVQLPTDPLLDYWSFCRAIARAICPAGEDGLEGIACIRGKQIRVEIRTLVSSTKDQQAMAAQSQLVLTSDDGRTLGQLLQDTSTANESGILDLQQEGQPKIVVTEFPLPYLLEDKDRFELEKLLPSLPPLRYPMSNEDIAEFMEAYRALSNRPEWEPTFVTAGDLQRAKAQQDTISDLHRKALQQDLADGRLVAVDEHNIPVKNLLVGTRIPRKYAIEYLERCGIQHSDASDQSALASLRPVFEPFDNSPQETFEAAGDKIPVAPTTVASDATNAMKTSSCVLSSDQTKPIASGKRRCQPSGLPTPEMAIAFSGLGGWGIDEWQRYLTEVKWPKEAMTHRGRPGKGGAALWDPVKLALLAQKKRDITLFQFTKVFRNTKSLKPWLEEWEEYVESDRRFRD